MDACCWSSLAATAVAAPTGCTSARGIATASAVAAMVAGSRWSRGGAVIIWSGLLRRSPSRWDV